MSDEVPEKKITVKLEEVPPWASELTVFVKSGFADLHERLDTMATNVDIQGDTVRDVAKRMTAMEERQNAADSRAANNSERAKAMGEVQTSAGLKDDKHDAAIAVLHQKVDRVLAIIERLDKIAANPLVRRIAYLVGAAVLAYLTAHLKGLI